MSNDVLGTRQRMYGKVWLDMKSQQKEETPIVILVYNQWDMAISNINELLNDFINIFVIDNDSEIDMSDHFINFSPNIKYIRLNKNYGWAGGYNRAIEKLYIEGYKSAFILNSDALISAKSVRSAINGLGAGIAAVGSIILECDGRVVAYDGIFNINHFPKSLEEVDPRRLPVRSVHGAAFALNLDAYREIGPFYERYFLYHEETDWCSEAKKNGYEILVDGSSHCYHRGGASSSNNNQEYYRTRNAFLALRRNNELIGVPNTWISFVAEGLKLRDGNRELNSARADGLLDGLFGRFGKRHSAWNPVARSALILFMKILIFPALTFRRVKKWLHPLN